VARAGGDVTGVVHVHKGKRSSRRNGHNHWRWTPYQAFSSGTLPRCDKGDQRAYVLQICC